MEARLRFGSVDKLKGIFDKLVEVTRKDALLSVKFGQPGKNKNTRSDFLAMDKNSWRKVENLIDLGRYDEAISVCESILLVDPENADSYYYLG